MSLPLPMTMELFFETSRSELISFEFPEQLTSYRSTSHVTAIGSPQAKAIYELCTKSKPLFSALIDLCNIKSSIYKLKMRNRPSIYFI
jgi:hypothetical protein